MEREKYTRVTEILNKYSGLHNVPEKILDGAKERGTAVHKYISGHLSALLIDIEPEYQGYADSFHKIEDLFEWVSEPGRLYCDKYKFTGEPDHLVMRNGRLGLMEFKTPIKESKSWRIQLILYKYLLKVFLNIEVQDLYAAKLDKFGNAAEIYQYEDDEEFGLNIVRIHRYFYGDK